MEDGAWTLASMVKVSMASWLHALAGESVEV
jgi:hypothetical protein